MPTVYITAQPDAAPEVARTLVEERLAACVNTVSCDSVYRWDGEIYDEEETILLAKTTDERYEELRRRVQEIHPYDLPCIERFDETDVLAAFGDWLHEETETERPSTEQDTG
jgi:periplasmic divalent cation tolerance protein